MVTKGVSTFPVADYNNNSRPTLQYYCQLVYTFKINGYSIYIFLNTSVALAYASLLNNSTSCLHIFVLLGGCERVWFQIYGYLNARLTEHSFTKPVYINTARPCTVESLSHRARGPLHLLSEA